MKATVRSMRNRQRGLSIVELMVGVAVGLIIVAAASMLAATQLSENRRVTLETQVQQDLRATADIIARELRRAGRAQDSDAINGIWMSDQLTQTAANPMGSLSIPVNAQGIEFNYFRSAGNTNFRFDRDAGAIRSYIGGGWQDLTDRNVLVISALSVSQHLGPTAPIRLMCPKLCPPPAPGAPPDPDGTGCWPLLSVRDVSVSITGYPASDPSMVRTVTSRVRLRNDVVTFNMAGGCP